MAVSLLRFPLQNLFSKIVEALRFNVRSAPTSVGLGGGTTVNLHRSTKDLTHIPLALRESGKLCLSRFVLWLVIHRMRQPATATVLFNSGSHKTVRHECGSAQNIV
jgi:hypothetical protein